MESPTANKLGKKVKCDSIDCIVAVSTTHLKVSQLSTNDET